MFPSIFIGSWVRYLIGPFLFRVSSTFEIGISFSLKSGEKTGARGKGGERATRGLNRCVNHT